MMTALFSLMLAQATSAEVPATPPSTPPTCEGAEYDAFDFWVGDWDVYPNVAEGEAEQVAESRIEKVSAGCAIRETWMPLKGRGGTSLSAYDPKTGGWHQLWVGGVPGRVFFDGGAIDGKMVLTGYWGKDRAGNPSLVRMTYSVQEDGSVRQRGQASSDHGVTWSDSFDLIYRRKE